MKSIKIISFLFLVAGLSAYFGCSKPKVTNPGLTETSLNAAFTVTPVSGNANRFIARSADSSYILSKWDLGDGAGAAIGPPSREIFLPDAGAYTITHYAVGKGGAAFSATQNVTVATSDPAAGNLVQGGKFANAADYAKWTLLKIGDTDPASIWKFNVGSATVSPSGWNQAGLYQAINVVANKKYKIDMVVSSPVGIQDCWFEVFASPTPPVQGSDYSVGGKRLAINTWAGCGTTPFSGLLSVIQCDGDGKPVSFPTSGLIYLVIKSGSGSNPSITIKNVEMRGI